MGFFYEANDSSCELKVDLKLNLTGMEVLGRPVEETEESNYKVRLLSGEDDIVIMRRT